MRALWLSLLALTPATSSWAVGETTLFSRDDADPWYLGGQINVIAQGHPSFRSPYAGENSLSAEADMRVSFVGTLYMGFLFSTGTEITAALEMAAGGGIGDALGAAAFTNLDVVRNPTLSSEPYLAKVALKQVFDLGGSQVTVARAPNALATKLPENRLSITLGKLSTVDAFDLNSAGSDSHRGFLSWAIDNNAAYDYAADTRGYSWGLQAELTLRDFSARLGLMAMPKVANGLEVDFNLFRARGLNLELELRQTWLFGRPGVIRLLGFANTANMGLYDEAIAASAGGRPSVETTRIQGRTKPGAGINLEETVVGDVVLFARASISDGALESFAYTECDDSVSGGAVAPGELWGRDGDRLGLAAVTSGLAGPHRRYLEHGGLGFLLGDGKLSYARETAVEAFYDAHVWSGLSVAVDGQLLANPGYNRDRGPVVVGALRMHVAI
ncbi:MAG: carbohydrate porin [Myxococcota bacterium]